ncbi:hypothetical protein BDV23DRAFT_155735 [Aspergillus alliaceus]|uniref:Myb-like DNA-binding domain protein n=1 Tax=Petromyces alliaceus TaxID=209559 RepID=A0A5N7C7W9_PETAA|nr:hypothetical protein BDV23DRAFT_155735 [Aspergillus alliaceus]
MGSGPSKKADDGLSDHPQKDNAAATPNRFNPLKPGKRKSSEHVNSSVALSPQNEEKPRLSKRTKLAHSLTEDNPSTKKPPTTNGDISFRIQYENSFKKPTSDPEIQSTPNEDTNTSSEPQESLAEPKPTPTPLLWTSQDGSTQQGEIRKGKRKREGKGQTGFFTPNEVQALEDFKIDFCNTNGLRADVFDAMVQHSEREKGVDFPCDSSITTKHEFWKTIYGILPNRERRSVYRFMRRHFQSSDVKPHHWTHEQDEELIRLVAQHGFKFALIAKEIGRNDDDVVQRWKNRLEHRTTMNRGPWSQKENVMLQDALQLAWKNLKEKGHDVGRDIYEIDETMISWGHISSKMGHCRSRQQCADKWRKARKKVQHLRENGNPDAVFDPLKESKRKNSKAKLKTATPTPTRTSVGHYKSNEYVISDDEGEDKEDHNTNSVNASPAKSISDVSKSTSESVESASVADSESADESASDDENATKAIAPKQTKSRHNSAQSGKKSKDKTIDPQPKAKSSKSPKQVTENKKNDIPKSSQSTTTTSASESGDSDSSSDSDTPASKQIVTNSGSKISPSAKKPSIIKTSKNKGMKNESSFEDDSNETSSGDEGSDESDKSESEVTSSSDHERTKSLKKSNAVKQKSQTSSSEEESSENESESSSDVSDSSSPESESKPSKPMSNKMDMLKRRRQAETSTSTIDSSPMSRDVKMEDVSE